jgi:hypothetical protein
MLGLAAGLSDGALPPQVTIRRLAAGAVLYEGRPETEHSWFPGWAWTICYCRG